MIKVNIKEDLEIIYKRVTTNDLWHQWLQPMMLIVYIIGYNSLNYIRIIDTEVVVDNYKVKHGHVCVMHQYDLLGNVYVKCMLWKQTFALP